MERSWLPYAAGGAICCLFLALGILFIPYTGAQYDETLFTMAIFRPEQVEATMKIPFTGLRVPSMLMTYIGTLKAGIYAPILKYAGATHATLRLPVLFFGAVSIWLFYLALRRLAGTKAAVLASLLLATDTLYLLTCVFDWGPVALQHLLFCAALYCGVRFAGDARSGWLFLGSLSAGLALWDKALFIWLLAGMSVALLAVFPKQLLALARNRRHAAAVVLGFILGASPFLYYNQKTRLRTFTANTEVDEQNALSKLIALDRTFSGAGIFAYIVRDESVGPVQDLKPWEKLPLRMNQVLKGPRDSWQHLLLVLALLAAPVLCWPGPNRKAALLFLLGGMVTYGLMIGTRKAGGSVHHTILLWPLPQLLLGLAAGAVAARWPRRIWAVTAMLIVGATASNLTVLNTHLAQLIAFGPAISWNDAIRPLVNELGRHQNRLVFAADWGILQQVEFYGRGRIGFHPGSDGIVLGLPDELSKKHLRASLEDPRLLFVTFTDGNDMFPGTRKKLLDFAAGEGYRDNLLAVIRDRHTAPIFEIHEFRR